MAKEIMGFIRDSMGRKLLRVTKVENLAGGEITVIVEADPGPTFEVHPVTASKNSMKFTFKVLQVRKL